MMTLFQQVIPPSDGSILSADTGSGSVLVQNIKNNLAAIGVKVECEGVVCEIDIPDPRDHARVLMLAILGNFMNKDLRDDDAIEHLQVDTGTGLLRRAHSAAWTRVMLTDVLLVLAVVMLAVRTLQTPVAAATGV